MNDERAERGHGPAIRFLFRDPPRTGRRPAIFLDRDGVINERIMDGYVTNWHEFQFIAGAQSGLREIARLRLPILVVSNQSGVGRGMVSRRALRQITGRFVAAIERRGARIDGVYYCPHRPDDACPCRKPKPGLLVQAAREWRVDLGASVMVGDALSDIEAARAAGCRGILLDATLTDVKCHPAGSPNQPPSIGSLAEVPSLVAKLLGES